MGLLTNIFNDDLTSSRDPLVIGHTGEMALGSFCILVRSNPSSASLSSNAIVLPSIHAVPSVRLAAPRAGAHLLFVNKLLRHTPRSSAVIRFSNGERIVVTIAPSGILIAKLRLRILRRRLVDWPRSDPRRLDRALVFFMSGPPSDLTGDTVLELMARRILGIAASQRTLAA
jgi:hypothetical protein